MAFIRHSNLFGPMSPFQEMTRMRREMDRLFSDLRESAAFSGGSGVFPAMNVHEDADRYAVEAEVAGVKPGDIEIAVEGNTLTLRGERKRDSKENVYYHRRERRAGSFQKAITLPAHINAEAVEAELKDGVLKLVLPKAEYAKPKRIGLKGQ